MNSTAAELTWPCCASITAGIASIHLELRARNEAAYAFYRALGFAETLRLPGYYLGRAAF